MWLRKSTWILLCVFAECFRQDPQKQMMKNLSKGIEEIYPGLVCRGIGVEEGDQYLYFQMVPSMSQQEALQFASQLKDTLQTKEVVLNVVRCVLVFQESGIYYQLHMTDEEHSIELLDA